MRRARLPRRDCSRAPAQCPQRTPPTAPRPPRTDRHSTGEFHPRRSPHSPQNANPWGKQDLMWFRLEAPPAVSANPPCPYAPDSKPRRLQAIQLRHVQFPLHLHPQVKKYLSSIPQNFQVFFQIFSANKYCTAHPQKFLQMKNGYVSKRKSNPYILNLPATPESHSDPTGTLRKQPFL